MRTADDDITYRDLEEHDNRMEVRLNEAVTRVTSHIKQSNHTASYLRIIVILVIVVCALAGVRVYDYITSPSLLPVIGTVSDSAIPTPTTIPE